MAHIGIAGAGFSGAVIARQLAEVGHRVSVLDTRDHVAGNCHTERDPASGVMVHVYGPHIFHTRWEHVWRYVNRYGTLRRYEHRVKATAGGRVYALPINLHTINQFFGTTLRPDEARSFVAERAERAEQREEIVSFEDRALTVVGPELYEAFLAGYTRKQWGIEPKELPASVLARLPLRFHYDDRYFDHPWQGMPEGGYTAIVEAILDHPGIEVRLSSALRRAEVGGFDHVVWTGPIDAYFDHEHGRLGYRTLDFERQLHAGDYQGCAVMNHCDPDVPFTRITEHQHFAPWEVHEKSVTYREFSRAAGPDDIPYYPIRLAREEAQLRRYVELARGERGVTFVGRLGTYRYLDMDVTIKEALDTADALRTGLAGEQRQIPAFLVDPLA